MIKKGLGGFQDRLDSNEAHITSVPPVKYSAFEEAIRSAVEQDKENQIQEKKSKYKIAHLLK